MPDPSEAAQCGSEVGRAVSARRGRPLISLKRANQKALRHGVFELRMDFGSGYRVYYGREGQTIIILLGGGSKRRQSADISTAVERWNRYQQTRA